MFARPLMGLNVVLLSLLLFAFQSQSHSAALLPYLDYVVYAFIALLQTVRVMYLQFTSLSRKSSPHSVLNKDRKVLTKRVKIRKYDIFFSICFSYWALD